MSVCLYCGIQVTQDDHGSWIDPTGGDGCDNTTNAHQVRTSFGVDPDGICAPWDGVTYPPDGRGTITYELSSVRQLPGPHVGPHHWAYKAQSKLPDPPPLTGIIKTTKGPARTPCPGCNQVHDKRFKGDGVCPCCGHLHWAHYPDGCGVKTCDCRWPG